MNRLQGKVVKIIDIEGFIQFTVDIDGVLFSVVSFSQNEIEVENQVDLLFKEIETILMKPPCGHISIRNRFECKVNSIEVSGILTQVNMLWRHFHLSSIITTEASRELAIQPGESMVALIKSSEIILART